MLPILLLSFVTIVLQYLAVTYMKKQGLYVSDSAQAVIAVPVAMMTVFVAAKVTDKIQNIYIGY